MDGFLHISCIFGGTPIPQNINWWSKGKLIAQFAINGQTHLFIVIYALFFMAFPYNFWTQLLFLAMINLVDNSGRLFIFFGFRWVASGSQFFRNLDGLRIIYKIALFTCCQAFLTFSIASVAATTILKLLYSLEWQWAVISIQFNVVLDFSIFVSEGKSSRNCMACERISFFLDLFYPISYLWFLLLLFYLAFWTGFNFNHGLQRPIFLFKLAFFISWNQLDRRWSTQLWVVVWASALAVFKLLKISGVLFRRFFLSGFRSSHRIYYLNWELIVLRNAAVLGAKLDI